MRKHLRILMTLFAALMLLAAACGSDSSSPSDTTGGDEGETPETTEGGDGEGAMVDGSEFTVALVYDVGGRGDQSFNDAAAEGFDNAEADYGFKVIELTPTGDGEDREENLRLAAEQGADLVIGNGFAFGDTIGGVAAEFPDVQFAVVDAVVEGDNIASLTFAEHEGSFLVGAAAALLSETGSIGFIGGVDFPLIQKFDAGYQAGAREVNPDIEITSTYISPAGDFSGFGDPAKATEIAKAQYDGGADVIFHAAGGSGNGLFTEASERTAAGTQVWAIGVDGDQYTLPTLSDVKDVIATSMVKRVDVAVFETIKAFMDGTPKTGVEVFDLSVDGVAYSTSGGAIDDLVAQLDELKAAIVAGDITVPDAL